MKRSASEELGPGASARPRIDTTRKRESETAIPQLEGESIAMDSITKVLQSLGLEPDLVEIFNPMRFASEAARFGLTAGMAFDITQCDPDDGQPWGFDVPAKRAKCKMKIAEDKPLFVI